MNKYIDAEKLKILVKRQIRWENLNFAALGGGGQTFCINTLEWVLKQIDSLQQEQPEVNIEEEDDNKCPICGCTLDMAGCCGCCGYGRR